MGNEKGENAVLPTMGEVAVITDERKKEEERNQMAKEQNDALSRRTLKIWDVPTELANKFIATARGSYSNKSWLYLQDLMKKANLYDEMVSSGRLEEHERRLANLEEFAQRMNELIVKAQQEEIKEEVKKPKTFGGD